MHVTMQQLLFYNFSLFQQTKPLNPKTVSLNPFLVPADCITQSGEYQFSQRSHKLVDAFEVELVKIQHWKFWLLEFPDYNDGMYSLFESNAWWHCSLWWDSKQPI